MTTVFRKASISKEKLKDIITKNPQSLMDGLSFIDLQLVTDEQGTIDFLGVDKAGRMVLVNFDTSSEDGMFITALSQMYWLKKNHGLIKRLFFSENIDFSLDPQMLLISDGFSGKLKSAVKQTKLQDIKLVEFKYIITQGKDAIIFEEVFTSKKVSTAEISFVQEKKGFVEEKNISEYEELQNNFAQPDNKQVNVPRLILRDVSLCPEEIAEFMEFEKTLEEKKISA